MLNGKIISISEITNDDMERMLSLMNIYFDNVKRKNFLRDINEKDFAIVMHDSANVLQGFSTIELIKDDIDGIRFNAVFCGDTIIHEAYHGTRELPRIIGNYLMELHLNNPDSKTYLFLISKGYKTYILLPRYFRKFYPSYKGGFPDFEKKAIDKLASGKFKEWYDKTEGIIRIPDNYFLKYSKYHITKGLMKNQDIAFFLSSNPGYVKGEELACLAEFSVENISSLFAQILDNKSNEK